MKKLVWFLISFSLLLLSSCINRDAINVNRDEIIKEQQNHYNEMCKSWIGKDINDLIRARGYPSQIGDMPNGNRMYVYSLSNSVQLNNPGLATYNRLGNMVIKNESMGISVPLTFWCNTSFEARSDGIIVSYRWEGNACR